MIGILVLLPVVVTDRAEAASAVNKPIRFGILGHVPYGYYTATGKSTGYLYEIENEKFEQAQYQKKYRNIAHKRLNQENRSGEGGLHHVRKRALYHFTVPDGGANWKVR